MKIYGDVISPFVRMCLVTAHEAGLASKVEWVKTSVKPNEVNPNLEKLSPIGKIPILETDHHHPIYDSRVIMEYLAHVGGSSTLIPDDGVKRFRVLTLLALAQGMGDAAVSLRYEQAARPEQYRWEELKNRFSRRIHSGLDDIETNWLEALNDVNVGTLSLACVLSYLDFRHEALNWRDGHNNTANFHKRFSERPSFKAWPLA